MFFVSCAFLIKIVIKHNVWPRATIIGFFLAPTYASFSIFATWIDNFLIIFITFYFFCSKGFFYRCPILNCKKLAKILQGATVWRRVPCCPNYFHILSYISWYLYVSYYMFLSRLLLLYYIIMWYHYYYVLGKVHIAFSINWSDLKIGQGFRYLLTYFILLPITSHSWEN